MNVAYTIAFDGVVYEVRRVRIYLTIGASIETFGPFATREAAEAEIKFQQSLDADKVRDHAGR